MRRFLSIGGLSLIIATAGAFSPLHAQPQPPSGGPPPSGQQKPPSGQQRPPSEQQRPPSGQQKPPSGQYQISEAMLKEYVSDQNRKLPTVIDNAIRWDSIALGTGRTLIYSYTFLDPSVQQINPQETNQIKSSIVQTICGSEQIRVLLDDAVSFNFQYRTSQGKLLTEVKINRADCR